MFQSGHFIPRFTTINWGVCLPASCDADEAKFVVRDALRHYNHSSGMSFYVNVDSIDCHTAKSHWWNKWMEIPTLLTV